jgi:B-box zinc finger
MTCSTRIGNYRVLGLNIIKMESGVNLVCISCQLAFKIDDLYPFILSCNHLLCKSCAYRSAICPIHRINEHKRWLESFLDTKSAPQGEPVPLSCETHKKKLEFYCSQCECLICFKCIVKHKDHDIIEEDKLNCITQAYKDHIGALIGQNIKTLNYYLMQLQRTDSVKASVDQGVNSQIEVSKKGLESVINVIDSIKSKDFKRFYSVNKDRLQAFSKTILETKKVLRIIEEKLASYTLKNRVIEEMSGIQCILQNQQLFYIPKITLKFSKPSEVNLIYYNSLKDDISLEESRYLDYFVLK